MDRKQGSLLSLFALAALSLVVYELVPSSARRVLRRTVVEQRNNLVKLTTTKAIGSKTSNQKWSEEEVSRIQSGLLGIDLVTITGARAAAHAIANGDLVRVTDAVEIADLQWLFRRFLTLSRFGSEAHGLFMPMRSANDSYDASRKSLDAAFAPDAYPKLAQHARLTAKLLVDPSNLPDDKVLGTAFAHAMADRFGVVPDYIMDAASKQTVSIADAFKPSVAIPASSALKKCYRYMEWRIKKRKLPKPAVVDHAHALLTPFVAGPNVLRAVADDPMKDTTKLFTDLGQVEQVLRMTTRKTTLGGMLAEDNPIVPRYTIVRINIQSAARETGNILWAFGSGTEDRVCAAKDEIMRYVRMVQDEVIRLRSA